MNWNRADKANYCDPPPVGVAKKLPTIFSAIVKKGVDNNDII
jgi:hypothetical protein